jgi:hypothetical protein
MVNFQNDQKHYQDLKSEVKKLELTATEKIEQAVINFIRGGDNRDTLLLENVLHKDFQFTNMNSIKTLDYSLCDKQNYLSSIKLGFLGELPRKISIERIDLKESRAMVKLLLESTESYSVSYNALVLDLDNEWRVTNNLAFEIKKINKLS